MQNTVNNLTKPLHRPFLALVLALGLLESQTTFASESVLAPVDLRCEYLKNPLGIDVRQPRLNWRLESGKRGARGQHQTAYHVLVANRESALSHDQGDLWDSGKVVSDQSVQVVYGGKGLPSQQSCWWKVRVWDEAGRVSAWSEPARWTMGLLQAEDWKAKWIGLDGGEECHPQFRDCNWIWFPEGNPTAGVPKATRYFRRTFRLPADRVVRLATVLVLADHRFVLSVNGTKVVDGSTFPLETEMDVTKWLRSGVNVLALEVGNNPRLPTSPAGLLAAVRILFESGEPFEIRTDGDWRSAREPNDRWRSVDFDDHAWVFAQSLGPAGIAPWGAVGEDEHRRLPARMLRREFALTKPVARATTSICGLGFFECYLNGRKVGDHVMDPALTRYDKRAMYVTFDVTGLLRRGTNAVGVLLGNGRFFAPRIRVPTLTSTFGYPKLLFQMHVEYADGSVAEFVSDEQWRITTDGPIRANNEFDGEEYDARREQPGWTEAGFRDAWQPVQVVQPPGGALVAQMLEPMRVTETLKPVGLTHPKTGTYLVDFGQNLYGVVRLKVKGPAGARVQIRTSFTKNPDGSIKMEDNRSARSTDVYILKGRGTEVWSPRFRGQGTHYAEVTGFPGVPTADNFELLVIHTDCQRVGEFACSNELLNQIHALVVRSARMQERSVPLDPDRDERQAWLGHPAKTSESEAYLFNVAAFYASFMGEIRIDQRADGNLSDAGSIWPFYSGDPVWPSVITVLPEWYYNFYADRRILEVNWETMQRWVRFQEKANVQADFTLKAGSYGDWVDAASMDGHAPDNGGTSRPLICTAYFYHNCRLLERVAGLLGKTDDAKSFSQLADKVRAGFLKRFFDPTTRTFESRTQCSYILPLAFGLVPVEYRAAVISNLVEEIVVKNQGHLSVGLVGMQWFMQALSDAGHAEVAYTVATRVTRPSWGYMISKGGTSSWERWDQDTRDPGMNGESQMILAGNLGSWFYKTLGGINYDPEHPGFKHIILQPRPVGDLKWVRASFQSLYGPIRSQWKIEHQRFLWTVAVPPNTTATVFVPTADKASVRVGGRPAWSVAGIKFLRMTENAAVCEIESGPYEFDSSLP
jgi:alpha-L-rhamnosidase